MNKINWKYIWTILRTYLINKYVLTLLIFAAIFIFVGEQSLLKSLKRGRQIDKMEQSIKEAEQAIDHTKQQLVNLQQLDSMEQFAREHYLMHKDNEDVFLVEEE